MDRVTQKDLEQLVQNINIATGNELEPYSKVFNEFGKYKPNSGNYHLSYAYGGVALDQMCVGGGVRRISNTGFGTKRELYNFLRGFNYGITDSIKRSA